MGGTQVLKQTVELLNWVAERREWELDPEAEIQFRYFRKKILVVIIKNIQKNGAMRKESKKGYSLFIKFISKKSR